jgi:hypothetical protein
MVSPKPALIPCLLFLAAESFVTIKRLAPYFHSAISSSSSTTTVGTKTSRRWPSSSSSASSALYYRGDNHANRDANEAVSNVLQNDPRDAWIAHGIEDFVGTLAPPPPVIKDCVDTGNDLLLLQEYRDHLKKELAIAAIEKYDMDAYNAGMATVAEDIMRKLEQVNPLAKPAHCADLNARWSFVFTGVPTVGMRLITLLSRLSVAFSSSLLKFDDVFLEVSKHQTEVKAIVATHILGVPVELDVITKLKPNVTDANGTFLVESFNKLVLAGAEIPTPPEWKSSRALEITYLDQDMMLARTAGGEPHLLLRHSPCSTDASDASIDAGDDDYCDIDMEVTPYFAEALSKYGSTISRSLVDRAFNAEGDNKLDIDNIVKLVQAILAGKNGHS